MKAPYNAIDGDASSWWMDPGPCGNSGRHQRVGDSWDQGQTAVNIPASGYDSNNNRFKKSISESMCINFDASPNDDGTIRRCEQLPNCFIECV